MHQSTAGHNQTNQTNALLDQTIYAKLHLDFRVAQQIIAELPWHWGNRGSLEHRF